MADLFYKQDASEIWGAPARLMVAPSTYPIATTIEEMINPTTYAPNTTYGLIDIGSTRNGVKVTRRSTQNEWSTDQYGLVKRFPTDFHSEIASEAMEPVQANRQVLMQGAAGSDTGSGEKRTYYGSDVTITEWRYYLLARENNRWHARVFPRCQWNGDAVAENFQRGEPNSIPFTVFAYPDENLVSPAGVATDRLDIDTP